MTRSKEIYSGQRNKEKRQLYKIFRHPDIESLFKKKFFELFEERCFKCNSKDSLDIDHHIPMALGGHLVAGNLVALCKKCNNKKHDNPPESFYTSEELGRLKWFLEEQKKIFNFKWDWDFYNRDKYSYFLSLGLDKRIVDEIFYNPEYRYYIPSGEESISATISVQDIIDEIKNQN